MLRKLTVKNYKGFKEETVFDLTNVKKYSFNEYSIKNDTIKNAIIYEKNGTGKSNLGLALFDLTIHLLKRHTIKAQGSAYLNGDSDEQYASFKYEFLIDNTHFTYLYRKSDAYRLVYESLLINDEKVYSYNFENKTGDWTNLSLIDLSLSDLPASFNDSILLYIYKLKKSDSHNPTTKLMDFIFRMLFFRTTVNGNEYIGFKDGIDSIQKEIIKQAKINEFQKFMATYNLTYQLELGKSVQGDDEIKIKFNHRIFPFLDVASHGTLTLMLLFYWLNNEKEISFLFIDEFDAFFHPELADRIIKDFTIFIDHQVILTTNNTNLMSNTLLRPDCYFIITKNQEVKTLPNATNRELREGHNLAKMYLGGAFDAS